MANDHHDEALYDARSHPLRTGDTRWSLVQSPTYPTSPISPIAPTGSSPPGNGTGGEAGHDEVSLLRRALGLPDPSSLLSSGLPPEDAELAEAVAQSDIAHTAARSLGAIGLTPEQVADAMKLPVSVVTLVLKADIEKGIAETTAKIGSSVVNSALSGDFKSAQLWLRAKGGWNPDPSSAALANPSNSVTQIVINTGVPSRPGEPTLVEAAPITLSKRDFQRIPELRDDE